MRPLAAQYPKSTVFLSKQSGTLEALLEMGLPKIKAQAVVLAGKWVVHKMQGDAPWQILVQCRI